MRVLNGRTLVSVSLVFCLQFTTFVSGSVYAITPTEVAKLRASDGIAGESFGFSVANDGDTFVIGAPRDDDNGNDSGSAYIFTRSGSTWTEQAKLLASDGAEFDVFGGSVAIADDTVVIGAYGDKDHGDISGSAYIFRERRAPEKGKSFRVFERVNHAWALASLSLPSRSMTTY